jgi:hypothetical protein
VKNTMNLIVVALTVCFTLSVLFLQLPACIDIDADGIPNRNDNCPVVAMKTSSTGIRMK